MEKVYLDAKKREKVGKEIAKSLRMSGEIPAVLYGQGNNELLTVNNSALIKLLHSHSAESTVIILKIHDGTKVREANVLIKELQYEPVKGDVLHVDFNEISLTEAIEVNVPLVSKGDPKGAKIEGGTLEHLLWELKIECLPTDIPANIEVDVTHMKIGDDILIKDIKVGEGIKVLHEPDQIALSLKPPHEEKPAEEGAVAEGEEGAPAEPEVIKQKSEEEIAKEAAEKAQEKKEKEK